jgi:hypothetical protein
MSDFSLFVNRYDATDHLSVSTRLQDSPDFAGVEAIPRLMPDADRRVNPHQFDRFVKK